MKKTNPRTKRGTSKRLLRAVILTTTLAIISIPTLTQIIPENTTQNTLSSKISEPIAEAIGPAQSQSMTDERGKNMIPVTGILVAPPTAPYKKGGNAITNPVEETSHNEVGTPKSEGHVEDFAEVFSSPQPRELTLVSSKHSKGKKNGSGIQNVDELMKDEDEKEFQPDLELINSIQTESTDSPEPTWEQLKKENPFRPNDTESQDKKESSSGSGGNNGLDGLSAIKGPIASQQTLNDSPSLTLTNNSAVSNKPKDRKLFWGAVKNAFSSAGKSMQKTFSSKSMKKFGKDTQKFFGIKGKKKKKIKGGFKKPRKRPWDEWSEMEKERYKRMKRFKPRKKIPKYKKGWWRPKVKLEKPKIDLTQYSPNYKPCTQHLRKGILAHCGTAKLGGHFQDVSGNLSYFASKTGEKWYSKQALIFRRYKMLQNTRKRKELKTAKKMLKGEFQAAQIEALTKHYTDMYNIHKQMVEKKTKIMEKSIDTLRHLVRKANGMTASSMMAVVKLGITQIMLKYSKKYPRIFEEKQEQIKEWKQFVLEMDHILYLEQEEKVEQWYIEREEKKKGAGGVVKQEEIKEEERNRKLVEAKQKQDEMLQAMQNSEKISTR